MDIDNPNSEQSQGWLSKMMDIYRESVANVPILRYSWIFIATIIILAVAAFFKLQNSDVFLYAVGVIFISFIGFIFSYLIKNGDKFTKWMLRIVVMAIVIVVCIAVLGFGTFIIFQKPDFYLRWFPAQGAAIEKNDDGLPPIEPTRPVNDSTGNDTTALNRRVSTSPFRMAGFSPGSVSVVKVADTTIQGLPCKYVTIHNKTGQSIVLTGPATDVTSYVPYLSTPETRVLTPLVIWDVTLPIKKGYQEFAAQNAVIVSNDDAVVIGVRFSCDSGGKKLSPRDVASYKFTLYFVGSDQLKVKIGDFKF